MNERLSSVYHDPMNARSNQSSCPHGRGRSPSASTRPGHRGLGRVTIALLATLAAAGPLSAQEGGLGIFTGETIFQYGTRVSISHLRESRTKLFRGDDRVANPMNQRLVEHRAILGLSHGVRNDFSVSALIPFVEKSFDSRVAGRKLRMDSFGLGDVAVLAKYRLMKQTWPRGAFTVAVIGGAELPTGRTDFRENGTRLPTSLQPGSGSVNPFASLAATYEEDLWRFDAQLFGKWNTRGARNFDDSDVYSAEIAAAYRFVHEPYPGPSHNFRLGLSYRQYTRARDDGPVLVNSGRSEWILRPALTMHPRPNIDIVIAADVPLHQHLRGTQLGLETRTFVAFGIRF